MNINVYNLDGNVVGDFELPSGLFDLKRNDELVHQVYLVQSSNRRSGSAHKKNRGEVRGGGKKPWKQKGTGRARVGSSRNPLWKGGGVVFGPTSAINFTKGLNVKMKRKALQIVLSDKFREGKVKLVESLELEEKKTRVFVKMLSGLNIQESSLMVFSEIEKGNYRMARNIKKVSTLETSQLNVLDLMNTEYLVMSRSSIEQMVEKYAS